MAQDISFDIIARDKTSSTFNKVASSSSKTNATLSKLGTVAKGAALGLGAATVAGAAFLVKVGAPYVDSLNKIQTLGDLTNKQIGQVAKTLEGSAGDFAKLGQTTGDAAAGMVELIKAGLGVNDSLTAVKATMTLAKAGELSVADASSLVANTLNTFSLKASQAGDIANYLANAANISSADVSDLAESFKYVAPVAAATGVSLKQTNAILAELSNSGIAASNAGTGFRKFLLSLQAPSGAAAKDLKDLGVQIFNAQGKMKPLGQVIGILGSKLKDLSDEKRQKILKDVFGLQGLSSAQVILKNGVAGLNRYTEGVGKAGAAQRLAESASRGLMGTLRMFKAEAISAGQAIYRAFSPLVDSALRPLALAFGDLTKNAGPALQRFVAQGPAKLKGALSGVGGSGFGKELAKTGSALASFGASMLPTLKKLGSELGSTLGPGLQQIGAVISGQFLPAFRNILPVIAPVAKILLNLFGSALIGAISGAMKVIKGLLTTISGVFNLIADLVHGRWGKIWGDLGQIAKGALGALVGALQVWWNVGILAIFKRGFLFLTKGIWLKGWELLKSSTGSAMKGLEGLFTRGLAAIGRALLAGVRGYLNLWRSYFGLIREVVTTGWKVIRSVFGGVIPALRTMLSTFLRGIGAGFRSAFAAAKEAVSAAMGAIRNAVNTGIGRAVLAVAKLPARMVAALGNLGGLLFNAGKAIIQGLINGIGAMVGALTSKLHSITNLIPKHKGPLDKDRKLLEPAGRAIMDGLIGGIEGRKVTLKKALAKVTAVFQSVHDKVSELTDMRSGFLSTFTSDSIFGVDMSNGGGIGALISFEQDQASKAAQLLADVQKVASMGLSKSLISQLQAAGSSGAEQLHALAGGSSAQIAQLNALDVATSSSLQAAGMFAGNTVRGGNINADINSAQAQEALLNRLVDRLEKLQNEKYIVVEIEGDHIVKAVKKRNKRKGVATAGM